MPASLFDEEEELNEKSFSLIGKLGFFSRFADLVAPEDDIPSSSKFKTTLGVRVGGTGLLDLSFCKASKNAADQKRSVWKIGCSRKYVYKY